MATKKPKLELEKETRERIASFFRSSGYVVQQEVKNPYGRADIIIKEYLPSGELRVHIVEVKRRNDSNSLKESISQLRHYAMHYGSNTKLYFCTSDKSKLSEESKRIMQANPDILYKVF
ncbi:hypothetical protein [Pseudanabaena phage PA-SR01]|nr:hypothetical protein [Pseudanabaena phage PA-SR01]